MPGQPAGKEGDVPAVHLVRPGGRQLWGRAVPGWSRPDLARWPRRSHHGGQTVERGATGQHGPFIEVAQMDLLHAEPFRGSGAHQPTDLLALLRTQRVGLVPVPVRHRHRHTRAGVASVVVGALG